MSNTEKFTGRVWVLGDDIDTDIIIPTEYLALPTVEDMKQYGFSPLRPELAGQIKEGDIIVAGWNFGCGSSREHCSSKTATSRMWSKKAMRLPSPWASPLRRTDRFSRSLLFRRI